MKTKVLKAINIKSVVTYAICGVLLGLILTYVPLSTLLELIILIVGFTLIGVNGYKLYIEFKYRKETTNQTLIDVIGVLLGFVLIMVRNSIVSILAAVYLIAFPVVDIVKAKGNKQVVLEKLPRMVLGLVVLFGGLIFVELIFKMIGIVIIVGSLLYLGYNYYLYKKSGVRIIK